MINVTADLDDEIANANDVVASLQETELPALLADFRGLSYSLGGEQQEQAEAMGALAAGFLFALFGMYALMAIAFKSYLQPLIIMIAIPFGTVGALWGHMIMGYDLSLMSMMGIVALAGVVVNDSLVLISAINEYRDDGMTPYQAALAGGHRRFRPIMLTSLTTFFGLMPMMLETSVQARFLIPMAISLGFGVMFVTFVALGIVPAVYVMVEDLRALLRRIGAFLFDRDEAVDHGPLVAEPAE